MESTWKTRQPNTLDGKRTSLSTKKDETMAKILVVEDDPDLLNLVSMALTSRGYQVQKCSGGDEALGMLRVYKFDLIILDWMMPDITGLDVCKQYRENGGKVPILMLTAKAKISDKEIGLDSGADDYLTKPFDNNELAARVRALLRRPPTMTGTTMEFGHIKIDPASCKVFKSGEEIHVRPKVYDLLEFFMRHPGQVFTAEALLARVWMDEASASPDTIRTHIKLLRKSIKEQGKPDLIETIRGKGYMLKADLKVS